jgi:hypothetical protein
MKKKLINEIKKRPWLLSRLKSAHANYIHLKFRFRVWRGDLKSSARYSRTMRDKKCYFGPYTGEFGHLLAHNLPFIAHLYDEGVEVGFCGMDIHRPFFVDETNREIVKSYLPLRDFFAESFADCNKAAEPPDVARITKVFLDEAKASGYTYWDNSDLEYYFHSFRWWLLKKGYMKAFDLSKVYATRDENAVVIFPRKWNTNAGPAQIRNNGQNWDYLEVARTVSPYFDKVYVVGHPVFASAGFDSFDNVEVRLTSDNREILEICSNSKLIITQHSGVNNLGVYTNCRVLMIYKGGREIGDLITTTTFRKGLNERYPLDYAFTMEEIEDYSKKFNSAGLQNKIVVNEFK